MGARFYPAVMMAALSVTAFGADLRIKVRVYDYAKLPAGTLGDAQKTAGHILRAAGVESTWHRCRLTENEPVRDPECGIARTPTDLVLRILPHNMADRMDKDGNVYGTSFGVAEGGFASHASIYYGRIEDLAKSRSTHCPLLAGHFLAHEIGHLLLGPDRHSQKGIMCVPFDRAQIQRAIWGNLLFTPEEADRIRSEVGKRTVASVSLRAQ